MTVDERWQLTFVADRPRRRISCDQLGKIEGPFSVTCTPGCAHEIAARTLPRARVVMRRK